MYIIRLPHQGICIRTVTELWLEAPCYGYEGEALVNFIAGMLLYHLGHDEPEVEEGSDVLDCVRGAVRHLDQCAIPPSERLFLDAMEYRPGIVCLIPRGVVLGGIPDLN